MIEMEIMDTEDAGNNEVEDCLWEWTTAVERRGYGGQENVQQNY